MLCKPQLTGSMSILTMCNGMKIKPLRRCWLTILKEIPESLVLEVVTVQDKTPLFMDACMALKLISVAEYVNVVGTELQHTSKSKGEEILAKYSDVFKGVACFPGEYDISMDNNECDTKRTRKYLLRVGENIVKQLNKLEELGIIKKVAAPMEWISSMVAVRKTNGSMRLCSDPQNLNRAIKRNHFDMTVIDELVANLKNAKVFTILDVKDGFLQVNLSEITDIQWRTAVSVVLISLVRGKRLFGITRYQTLHGKKWEWTCFIIEVIPFSSSWIIIRISLK